MAGGLAGGAGLVPALAPQGVAFGAPTGTILGVQKGVGVFAMSADGAGVHVVVPDPKASAVAGAPGSTLIAYGDTGSSTLTIASLTGTTEASVATPGVTGSVTSIAWSPDAQRVAYTVCDGPGAACQIALSSIDGTQTASVPAPAGVNPERGLSWGAQGLVVSGSYTGATACAGCPAGLYVVDPSGLTAPTPLPVPGPPGSPAPLGEPAASSVGGMAFISSADGRSNQVYASPSPAALARPLGGAFTDPAWSPDGSTLLITNGYQVLEDRPALPGSPQVIATFKAYGLGSFSWVDGGDSTAGCSVALPSGSVQAMASAPDGRGYWITDSYGDVSGCGDTGDFGGLGGIHLNQPVLDLAVTPDGGGYWLVAYDGGVFTFGDAVPEPQNGRAGAPISLGGQRLAAPIWAMAATKDGNGYWLVGTDGGVFTFGDAAFYGSAVPWHPSHPIVGIAVTRTGAGYWLATSDGTVYAFGDARAARTGTVGAGAPPIVGIATDPAAPTGYWLLAADGTVSGFGGAPAVGSSPRGPVSQRSIASVPNGAGGWVVDANGTVSTLGSAIAAGSAN